VLFVTYTATLVMSYNEYMKTLYTAW